MLSGITVLTALVCVMLMGVVLIQNPKGGGLGAGFGGGGGASAFGGVQRTTDFLEKATWGLAVALLVFCIFINAFINTDTTSSDSFGSDETFELLDE